MIQNIKIKPIAESISEVMIAEWLKKDGDFVKMDDALCSLETDKATVDVIAETSGILKISAPKGSVLKIGAVIGTIDASAAPAAPTTPAAKPASDPAPSKATPPAAEGHYAQGHPSPSAKKLMDEKGLSSSQVQGTGVDGRITKEDVVKSSASSAAPLSKPAVPAISSASSASVSNDGIRREKMSMLRRKLAQRLVAMKQNTAMLTTFNEVNMSAVMNIRNLYKDSFQKKYGVKLGFMSFFTKAVCQAIKEYPIINAQIDGEDIVYFDHSHIGIAVSAPRGLVVPVIRNAETLSFAAIEQRIIQYADAVKNGTLAIQDMEGGTFTITNGGTFGSMLSTPLLNPPQSAILGMHNIVERPIAVNGEVKVAPIMYLALSYDHRLIDGRDSVSFLVRVKQLLEDPNRMFLEA